MARSNLRDYLKGSLRPHADNIWNKSRITLYDLQKGDTCQGNVHCINEEDNIYKILYDLKKNKNLSDVEIFTLTISACFHDIGKSVDINSADVNLDHREESSNIHKKYYTELDFTRDQANAIGLVSSQASRVERFLIVISYCMRHSTVDSILGSGNFEAVFKSQQHFLDVSTRRVAIKLSKQTNVNLEKAKEIFADVFALVEAMDEIMCVEAKKYLVQIYDAGIVKEDGRMFVIMDFIQNTDPAKRYMHAGELKQALDDLKDLDALKHPDLAIRKCLSTSRRLLAKDNLNDACDYFESCLKFPDIPKETHFFILWEYGEALMIKGYFKEAAIKRVAAWKIAKGSGAILRKRSERV